MLRNQEHGTTVIIAKASDTQTTTGDVNDGLAAGVVAVVKLDGTAIDTSGAVALSAGDKFKVVQGTGLGKPLIKSATFTYGTATATTRAFTTPSEQVSFIGWNGVSGNLPTTGTSSTPAEGNFRLKYTNNTPRDRANAWPAVNADYYITGAGTWASVEEAVAQDLISSFNGSIADDPATRVVAGLVNKEALVAGDDFDAAMTIVKGSNVVNVATSLAYGGAAHTAVAGDYIRIGAYSDTAVTLKSHVYKIISVDTLALTLDRAVTEKSATIATGSNFNQVIAAADIDSWGLKISSVPNPFDVSAQRDYVKNSFDLILSESMTDLGILNTKDATASKGTGTAEQAAFDEYETLGLEGSGFILGTPPNMGRVNNAVVTQDAPASVAITAMADAVLPYHKAGYSVIVLSEDFNAPHMIGAGTIKKSCVMYLEIADGTAVGTKNDVSPNGEMLLNTAGLAGTATSLDATLFA